MANKIYFDMDGTIADFYGVEGWLEYLQNSDTTPYKLAKPLLNFSLFARLLNKVQKEGYEIGIISWTSKCGDAEFNERIAEVKKDWLNKHLPSVQWNEINIVRYGYAKQQFASAEGFDILFDDETPNRDNWFGEAKTPNEILETLKSLVA